MYELDLAQYKLSRFPGSMLEVLTYPHTILSKKSIPITEKDFNNDLFELAKDMLYTMYLSPGVGLAAPQVGKSIQMFVMDVDFNRIDLSAPDIENTEDTENDDNYNNNTEAIETAANSTPTSPLSSDQICTKFSAFLAEAKNKDKDYDLIDHYIYSDFAPTVLINPAIVANEGQIKYKEGCLSLPGVYEEVERSQKVVVEYLDLNSKKKVLAAEGLQAVCIQHELDHLNGIVLIERLSFLKKGLHQKRLKKLKKQKQK
ncbi:MAG: peptide deformylase [Oligoflexia bacterium]|nr:peptide deformylase [Oligoflexia bacterium]